MNSRQWLLGVMSVGVATAPVWRLLIKKPLEPLHFVFFALSSVLLAVSVWAPKAPPIVDFAIIPTLIFGVGFDYDHRSVA